MQKKIVIIGIIALLFCVGLSGCNEQKPETITPKPNKSWEVTGCSREIGYFDYIFDYGGKTYKSNEQGINSVSLTIKNTGDVITTYIVDFEFIAEKLVADPLPSIYIWDRNECPCSNVYGGNSDSNYNQQTTTIAPGETRTVYSSCNPNPVKDMVVHEWCYEVTYE